MKKHMQNLEIFPKVAALFDIHAKYKNYDAVTYRHTMLACGYRDLNQEERLQFIEEMKKDGEDVSWIPFVTKEEQKAYYEKSDREQRKKTIAEELEAQKKSLEIQKEKQRKWLLRSQRNQ